jgi:hypothetical protein
MKSVIPRGTITGQYPGTGTGTGNSYYGSCRGKRVNKRFSFRKGPLPSFNLKASEPVPFPLALKNVPESSTGKGSGLDLGGSNTKDGILKEKDADTTDEGVGSSNARTVPSVLNCDACKDDEDDDDDELRAPPYACLANYSAHLAVSEHSRLRFTIYLTYTLQALGLLC